jgi:hypothetical protein
MLLNLVYKHSNDYFLAFGIAVEHFVPYVNTQNVLEESLIKSIKLIEDHSNRTVVSQPRSPRR